MSNKNVHTVHNEKGWTNRYENSNRTLGYYDTKAKAQAAGRDKAMKNGVEHVIHGLNGRIQNKNSYGSDPCPPKDKIKARPEMVLLLMQKKEKKMKKVVIDIILIILAGIFLILNIPYGTEIAFALIGIVLAEIYDFLIQFAGNLKMLFKILWNWNRQVRISFAYLFRIKVGNNYLLIMGNRIHKYQPVGGVYKFYDLNYLQKINFNEMDEMKANGENDKDLRGRIPANKLPKLIKWFKSQECREYDANREFNEELIYSGILDEKTFRNIEYKKVRTIESGIIKTPNYGLEYKIFDIVELIPNENQKRYLEELMKNNTNPKIAFVTEDEIRKHKRNGNIDNYTNDITDHSESIL